jgi:hypothetical protein
MWTILACPSPGGGRPLNRFVADLGPQAENGFAAVLDVLRTLDRRFWTRPQFDLLHGKKYKGLGEIRFDGESKTYRVFGYFGPDRFHFTLLLGCEKKRSLKHEMDEAAKRKKFAEENHGVLYVFTFETIPSRKAGGF